MDGTAVWEKGRTMTKAYILVLVSICMVVTSCGRSRPFEEARSNAQQAEKVYAEIDNIIETVRPLMTFHLESDGTFDLPCIVVRHVDTPPLEIPPLVLRIPTTGLQQTKEEVFEGPSASGRTPL